MSLIITAEHFSLSSEHKSQIEQMMTKLTRVLPESAQIRLFLKLQAKGGFQAVLAVHNQDRDLVYTESGDNLFALIRAVKTHTLRNWIEHKEKRVHGRRKPASIGEGEATAV